MKRLFALLLFSLPLFVLSQKDSIIGGVYNWKEPVKTSNYSASAVLFEGSTQDMEWLQMSSNILYPTKVKAEMHVPDNEELLLIVRSGKLKLNIKDSIFTIGDGSISLLLPGAIYSLQSTQDTCSYYVLHYRSKLQKGIEKQKQNFTIINWDTVVFKPGEKGGRRNFLEQSTAMCKRLEIHATTLKEGLRSHTPHTHKAAEFTLIKEGQTQMLIGNETYKGNTGSIYYAPSNVLHALENTGTGNCTYFAIQFE